jgi:carbon-monoxide dehydrogenase large subunit
MSTDNSIAARYGSGQSLRRIEDPALVQGQGRFTDDVVPARPAVLVFVRSTVAHGRIVASTSTPRAPRRAWWPSTPAPTWWPPASSPSPPRRPSSGPTASPWPRRPSAAGARPGRALCRRAGGGHRGRQRARRPRPRRSRVRRDRRPAGQRRPGARAAARRAGAVGRCARQHLRRDAPRRRRGRRAAFTPAAAHTVSLDLVNQRLAPAPMEPRSVLAYIDGRPPGHAPVQPDAHRRARRPGRRHPGPDAPSRCAWWWATWAAASA